ncbi:CdaR family protein [Paenibacillus shenyangensis]|uniref:CdaR family protein n=1 Tax=Paenibacillus sp. A9 TaxID=1284352 RepID=UPI00037169E2|nr:CdaR family protein [Paenibacillus sp. A9]
MMDKWISNNTVAKVLALVVSILLWIMVHMDNNTLPMQSSASQVGTSVINDVQVQPYGFDEDKYVLKSIEPSTVSIEVRGTRPDLLPSDSYKAKVDLSQIKGAGTVSLPLITDTPASVQYVSSTPSVVKVTIEEKTSNAFVPEIITQGEPAAGYQKGTPVITDGTDKVSVTLPQSRLEDVQKVQGVISVADATDTVSKTVALAVYDKAGNVMKDAVISPSSVKAEVPIGAATRTLPLNLSYTGQLPNSLVLAGTEVSADQITVYGSESALAALGDSITASVDLSSIEQAGTVTLTAKLDLPEGTERISPSSVQVKITTEEFSERVIQNVPIGLVGTGSNLEAVITKPQSKQVSLNIKGSPEALQAVKPEDIKATANLNGRGPGTYTIPVQIVLPETVSLTDPGIKLNVTVTITESANSSGAGNGTGDNGQSNGAGTTEEGEAESGAGTGTAVPDSSNPEEQPGTNSGTGNEQQPDTPPAEGEQPEAGTPPVSSNEPTTPATPSTEENTEQKQGAVSKNGETTTSAKAVFSTTYH